MLLDEIEKAHADVFNILLQVMDDGRLTDGQGRTVSFTNTVLIMTSNVAGGLEGVQSTFKPEFVNRLDDIVIFDALRPDELGAIVDIQVGGLDRRLADRRLIVEVTDAARQWLGERGYDPMYGAAAGGAAAGATRTAEAGTGSQPDASDDVIEGEPLDDL